MSSIRVLLTALCLVLVVALSCSDDPTTPPGEDTTWTADVYFGFTVNGQPLQLNLMNYDTPAGTKYSVKTLRFVISDLRLHTDDGKSVVVSPLHYYDLDILSSQSIHVTRMPHANYVSVSFRWGLTTANNARNSHPSIPDIMVWPTDLGPDLGYHYMQLEGNYEKDPVTHETGGYTTHTGPRHLDGTSIDFPGVVDATAYDFSFPVSASFTPAHVHEGGHGELDINIDLNGWYTDHTPADGVDTQYDFKTLSHQMVMGDLDLQGKLQTNGPGCFSATLAAHGGHDH